MKRLLTSIAFALAAAAGQADQANWLYWSVAEAATPDGAVEFAYAVLCDGEDWTRTYAVGETDASKVRANADAHSTPAVASNISGSSGTASAEPSSFVVLLYDAENEVVAVSKTVSRETLAKHLYVDMRTAGEGTPYVFSTYVEPGGWILKVNTVSGGNSIAIDSDFVDTYRSEFKDVSEMSTFMNGNGANGLKVWQDYVLGLDHTDSNATIRIAAEPRPDGQTGVRICPIKKLVPRTSTGFSVSYRLKGPDDATVKTSQSQEFDVGLPESGGRYRLEVLIYANPESEPDVIPAENIVGIQGVECAGTNVVLAVPFVATEGGDITVSNLLSTAGLAPGDRLFRWDGDRYERWTLPESGGSAPLQWTAEQVFTVGKQGTQKKQEWSAGADVRTVGVGTGLWLTRTKGAPTRLFLTGTVTNEIPAVSVPNLSTRIVANPLEEAARPTIKTPAEGDTIQFPTSAGALRVYRFWKGKWVCCEGGTQKAGLLPLVPAGTGFWYVSMGTKEVQISWGK